MSPRLPLLSFIVAAACCQAAVPVVVGPNHGPDMARGMELFKSSVGQTLRDHCVDCHGGEKGTKGDLDLATREGLLLGGADGPSVVPGKSGESLLMRMVRHEEDPPMPKKAPKLSDEIIARLAEWIDLGAPYATPLLAGKQGPRDKAKVSDTDRQFWAFQPLASVEPPQVPAVPGWPASPVDPFILTALHRQGIMPNPPVSKRQLIRRAYLDLTGLPPSPKEVEDFAGDISADAYPRLLDRLLASPHYGERWGRHWLDLARYGESHGYEQDYDRKFAYQYRDFVIRALNEDLPYDRFVQWQIAGDELAPDNPDAWFATGFLAAGTHATQITANQAEKERYDELDDKIATIGTAMLGLTVGCARCHDHKFDPIPANDYYRLLSTFTTTVRSDYDVEMNPARDRERHRLWKVEQDRLEAGLQAWEAEHLPGILAGIDLSAGAVRFPAWVTLEAQKLSISGAYHAIVRHDRQADGSYLVGVSAGTPDTYTFAARVTLPGALTAIRLEALPDRSLPGYGPGWSATGGFDLREWSISAKAASGKAEALRIREQTTSTDAAASPAGPWKVEDAPRRQWLVGWLEAPVELKGEVELTFTMKFDASFDRTNLGKFRLALATTGNPDPEAETLPIKDAQAARLALEMPADKRTADQVAAISILARRMVPEWVRLSEEARLHELAEPRPELAKALICSDGVPAVRLHTQGPDFYDKTFQLKRGDLNQKQGEATPGFLQILTRAPLESRWMIAPSGNALTPLRRAALARWITDEEAGAGELVARVIVNRLWQHHMGQGLVRTPSDFGAQGEKPTHPELLDWMASELIRGGWRLKPMHRIIMLSAAYQQSAEKSAEALKKDPTNALWWHRPRRRLEGEVIRDSILSVTGLLDRRMFGPGSQDQAMRRRSIYYTLKRSQLPPMLGTFDGPDTLQSMGQRASTTVAPQALFLMNNTAVRRAAQEWAVRLLATSGDSVQDSVAEAYHAALGRPPDAREMSVSLAFVDKQAGTYRAAAGASPVSAALGDLCQSLLSLNEFCYVP